MSHRDQLELDRRLLGCSAIYFMVENEVMLMLHDHEAARGDAIMSFYGQVCFQAPAT